VASGSCGVERLEQAERRNENSGRRHENVLGAEIAVPHAALVRVLERAGQIDSDAKGLLHRELAFTRETIAQRVAVGRGSHEIQNPAG
jgi:hypothetical protein